MSYKNYLMMKTIIDIKILMKEIVQLRMLISVPGDEYQYIFFLRNILIIDPLNQNKKHPEINPIKIDSNIFSIIRKNKIIIIFNNL